MQPISWGWGTSDLQKSFALVLLRHLSSNIINTSMHYTSPKESVLVIIFGLKFIKCLTKYSKLTLKLITVYILSSVRGIKSNCHYWMFIVKSKSLLKFQAVHKMLRTPAWCHSCLWYNNSFSVKHLRILTQASSQYVHMHCLTRPINILWILDSMKLIK